MRYVRRCSTLPELRGYPLLAAITACLIAAGVLAFTVLFVFGVGIHCLMHH